MDSKTNTKRKLDFMKSVMTDKKLAKVLKEALDSPIGSTKRDQARAIFSIMKKLGKLNDGVGGLAPMPAPESQGPAPKNYGNMMVFPAAPRFKVKARPVAPITSPTNVNDGQGGFLDNFTGLSTPASFTGFGSTSPTLFSLTPPPTQPSSGYVQRATTGSAPQTNFIPSNFSFSAPTSTSFQSAKDLTSIDLSGISPTIQKPSGLSGGGTISAINPAWQDFQLKEMARRRTEALKTPTSTTLKQGDTGDAVRALQNQLVAGGFLSAADMATGPGIYGPKTAAAVAKQALASRSGEVQLGNQTTTLNGITYNSAGDIIPQKTRETTGSPLGGTSGGTSGGTVGASSAANYMSQGKSSVEYAQDIANAAFGGNFDEHALKVKNDLEARYNLDANLAELDNLRAAKENFIPSLESYIVGKDEYMKEIDLLIEKAQENRSRLDMGDPAVNASYRKYMAYLTTMKGRQNKRYGDFVASAIADYNADVATAQSNYDKLRADFTEELTTTLTMDQNRYNQLYARAESVYTELENAKTKQINNAILQKQLDALNLATVGGAQVLDENYYKNLDGFTKQYTIASTATKNDNEIGTLDFAKIPPEGIFGLYQQLDIAGQPNAQAALTEVLRVAITRSLNAFANDPKKIAQIMKLVKDIDIYDPSQTISSVLLGRTADAPSSAYSKYIQSNLPVVESALKDLLIGWTPWYWKNRSAGIEDKAGWLAKYNTKLDPNFLESLYVGVQKNSEGQTDRESYLSNLLQGTPEEKAALIASVID